MTPSSKILSTRDTRHSHKEQTAAALKNASPCIYLATILFNPDVQVTGLSAGAPDLRQRHPIMLCAERTSGIQTPPTEEAATCGWNKGASRLWVTVKGHRMCVCVCAERGTKSPANPFYGNGCRPSNPFKFHLAIDEKKKKGLRDRSLFSDWREKKKHT